MCGFIAQLEEHPTGIVEVTGSNPMIFFVWLFFQIAKIGGLVVRIIPLLETNYNCLHDVMNGN